jgi:hypothetical protein
MMVFDLANTSSKPLGFGRPPPKAPAARTNDVKPRSRCF